MGKNAGRWGAAIAGALILAFAQSATAREVSTAEFYTYAQSRPPLLRALLYQMPKGGDLHNHLSGAVYAETYLKWAAEDGLCIHAADHAIARPPKGRSTGPDACPAQEGLQPAQAVFANSKLFAAMIDSLSMRGFVPGRETGHDHFFATFGKFGPAGQGREGDMLAAVVRRAAAQNEIYLELMTSFERPEVDALAHKAEAAGPWNDNFALLERRLDSVGLDTLLPKAKSSLDAALSRMDSLLHCADPHPEAACHVTLRFIGQVGRTGTPAEVFAQAMFAARLSRLDPRVVGLNLVAPEDDPRALADYTLQMKMLAYLNHTMGSKAPNIALHAGELTLGLVPPRYLADHIREAVEIAGAKRIGHGVDVFDEAHPFELVREMRRKGTLVEINLTSNRDILGVSGKDHPFPYLLAYGVPLTLSTDDEGVERTDLTQQYVTAASSYGLTLSQLKMLARNSLTYSFLPGRSLWASRTARLPVRDCAGQIGQEVPRGACRRFLNGNAKAREQWRLEARFATFDSRRWEIPDSAPSALRANR